MKKERTLSVIKPDGVKNRLIGRILQRFEDAGISIISAKIMLLTREQATSFYEEHAQSPFFQELVSFMTSGPIFVSLLEGVDVISQNRKIMGHTDPKKASKGTIRNDFGGSIGENTIHGSDSLESAIREIKFFFGN